MSCRTQHYDRRNIHRLVPDTDGLQWLLLLHGQHGTAELIPLKRYEDDCCEPAPRKTGKTIHFRFAPVNDTGTP